MTMTAAHPLRAGRSNASWYLAGQLVSLALRALFVGAIVLVLRDLGSVLVVTLTILPAMVAALHVRRRMLRAAWADVPGAFQSSSRGDNLDKSRQLDLELAWAVARLTVWITGGVVLVSMTFAGVERPVQAGIVVAVGGWFLGGWGAFLAPATAAPNSHWLWRWNLPTLAEGLAWVAIGFVATTEVTTAFLVLGGMVALLGFTTTHFARRLSEGDARDE